MRQIINISLTKSMADYVNLSVKKGGFASKSEFFRSLLREKSESEIIKSLKTRRKEMQKGNKFLLKSFKDLKKL